MSNFAVDTTTPPITRQELGAVFSNNPKLVRAFTDLLNDVRKTLPNAIITTNGDAATALAAAQAAQSTATTALENAATAQASANAAQATANTAVAGVTALEAVPYVLAFASSTVPDGLVLTPAASNVTLTAVGGNLVLNVTGAAPTGAAGGDLSGTFPNPTVHTFNGGTAFGSAAGAAIGLFAQVANNLSDLGSAATARGNLGLGTAATQASTFFAQVANNLSDLTSASAARGNLGLGSAALLAAAAVLQSANNLSDLANVATARSNLGLGTMATQASAAVAITGGTVNGTTVGVTTPAAAQFTQATITDPSNNTGAFTLVGTGSNGANFKLTGNGSTPNKTLRANNGHLQVINSAYGAIIFDVDDTGDLTVTGGFSFAPATTTTAPAAGGAGALPATPAGYMTVTVGGTARKVPYY